MANILLRSPYYINLTEAGSATAQLNLYIEGTLEYTMTKETSATGDVLFEISELAKDYLEPQFSGAYESQTIGISAEVTFFNSEGSVIGDPTPVIENHIGFYGYSEFTEGANATLPANEILQSNTTIYVPENTGGYIPYESAAGITADTTTLFADTTLIRADNDAGDIAIGYLYFNTTQTSTTVEGQEITINRVCEPKYDPIKITFVNKFGALQDLWFFKKRVETLNVSRELFNRNIITSTGGYSTFRHTKSTLSVMANESFNANTGFMDESMNEPMKQMLLSDHVWATINSLTTPIVITSSELTYKNSVNDKLINYTIEFEYAYDTINNIR